MSGSVRGCTDGTRRARGKGAGAAGRAVALGAALCTLLVWGCSSTIRIGKLLEDPFRYNGETVRVEGEVREAVGFLGPGIYRLDDGSGTLPVVNRDRGAPRSGSRVKVEGTFRAAFTIADRSLAVLVESSRSDP